MEKRLVKGKDRKLFGVCSGIADYFGWDPTLVRIGFAFLFLVYGIGLLGYLVAAIVMPSE